MTYRFGEHREFRFETFDETVQIVLGGGGYFGVVDVHKTGDVFRHVLEFFFERNTPVGVGGFAVDLNRHNISSCYFGFRSSGARAIIT